MHVVLSPDAILLNRNVDILLVDESEMRDINLKERGMDYSTDVLSFPFYSVRTMRSVPRSFAPPSNLHVTIFPPQNLIVPGRLPLVGKARHLGDTIFSVQDIESNCANEG